MDEGKLKYVLCHRSRGWTDTLEITFLDLNNNYGSNYGTHYYKSTSVPDCVSVLQSWCSSYQTTVTMTSCIGTCEAFRSDKAGGFWKGFRTSPGEPHSAAIW